MKRSNLLDWNLALYIGGCLLFIAILWSESYALTRSVRTVHMKDTSVRKVWVKPGRGTVLNFPMKPTKAILGSANSFKLEYVQEDIVVGATRSGARTNLFVYLADRRFAFDLIASQSRNDEIVVVRDHKDQQVKAEVK